MSAYVVVHITIKDAEKFQAYAEPAGATIRAAGGESLFRGKVARVLAGQHDHQMAAVLKFPDQGAVEAWYRSDDYQALIPNRDEAADVVLISLDEPPA